MILRNYTNGGEYISLSGAETGLIRDNTTADEHKSADLNNSKLVYKNLRAINISYSLFSETLIFDNQ